MSAGFKIKIVKKSLYEDQEVKNEKDIEFLSAQLKRDSEKIKEFGEFDFSLITSGNFTEYKQDIQKLAKTKYFYHYFKVYEKNKAQSFKLFGSGLEYNGNTFNFDEFLLDNVSDTKLTICTKDDIVDLMGPGEKIKKIYDNYTNLAIRGEYRAVVLQDFTDPHNKVIKKYTSGTVVQQSPDNLWICLKTNEGSDWVPLQLIHPIYSPLSVKIIDIFTIKFVIRKIRTDDSHPLKKSDSLTLGAAPLSNSNLNEKRRSIVDKTQVNPTKVIDSQLSKELEQFHFIDYALKYFVKQDSTAAAVGTLKRSKEKKTDWGMQNTVDLVKFSKQVLKFPLTQLMMNLRDKDDAVETFNNIMVYMGDLPNDRLSKEDAALNLLRLAKKYPELLEEVICQLIKQTTNNKGNGDSEKRGWTLIKLICIFTKPSKQIEPYFKRHIITTATNATKSWNVTAEECLKFLKAKETFKDRAQLPTIEELQAIENDKCVSLPIYIGAQSQNFDVELLSTVGEVLDIIANKIPMTDDLYNACTICGALPDGEAIIPEDHHYILDIFSQLKQTPLKIKVKDPLTHRLVLTKLSWALPPQLPGCYPEFSQIAANIVLGKWITAVDMANAKDKIVDIYAILCKYKDCPEKDIPLLFTDNLNKELMALKSDIFKKVPFYSSYTKEKLHDAIIQLACQLKLYGGFSYYMQVPDFPKTKKEAMVTINNKGLYIHETSKMEEVLFIAFNKVLNIRVTEQDVMITHGDLIKKTTVKLVTHQGAIVNALYFQFI